MNVILEQVDAVKTASTWLVHLCAAVEVDTSWQAMEETAMVWVYLILNGRHNEPVMVLPPSYAVCKHSYR